MKNTSVSYCQSCHKDFDRSGETVYFVVIDNNVVCKSCKDGANVIDVEQRIFIES